MQSFKVLCSSSSSSFQQCHSHIILPNADNNLTRDEGDKMITMKECIAVFTSRHP